MSRHLLVLLLVFSAGIAGAADPVTEAMQKAYGPYRVALFKTNNDAQEESRQAVIQAQQGWKQIADKFGAKPPVPYDRDAAFSDSLAEVSRVYAKALDEIGRNQLTQAHETLEEARDVMAEMRRRNHVVVFSDHMNAYHAEMEHIVSQGEKLLAQPNGMLLLTARAGVLEYLASRLQSEAPADYLNNEEFKGLLTSVNASVAEFKTALLAQDATKVKEAIGKIKKPYSRLFIKFG